MTFYGSPTYSIKYYREGMYKLIKFHSPRSCCLRGREEEKQNDQKLDCALARARSVVYQLAVCNDWDFFFTGTISPEKYIRTDLNSFRNKLSQFVRDLRKKDGYENLAYVLIPEKHKDGAWHVHGLIKGLPDSALTYFVPGIHPKSLIDGEYRNWSDYSEKFGYCSLGKIKDPEAVSNYLTKYISKDLASSVTDVGGHTYYCTRGLKRAVPFGYVFDSVVSLDTFLEHHGRFVSTGYVRGVSWEFWFDYIDLSDIEMFGVDDYVEELSDQEWEQLYIDGFPSSTYHSPYGGIV